MTVKVEMVSKLTEVPLETPMRVAGEMVDVLTFRKPVAGDLRVFDSNKGQFDAVLQLCARLSVPEMTPKEAEKMGLEDFQKVQDLFTSFLGSALTPKSPPAL